MSTEEYWSLRKRLDQAHHDDIIDDVELERAIQVLDATINLDAEIDFLLKRGY